MRSSRRRFGIDLVYRFHAIAPRDVVHRSCALKPDSRRWLVVAIRGGSASSRDRVLPRGRLGEAHGLGQQAVLSLAFASSKAGEDAAEIPTPGRVEVYIGKAVQRTAIAATDLDEAIFLGVVRDALSGSRELRRLVPGTSERQFGASIRANL